jgi:hypothetical protein
MSDKNDIWDDLEIDDFEEPDETQLSQSKS